MYDLDPYKVRKDDHIVFYNPRLGIPIIAANVVEVDYEDQSVTFDKILPDMQAGNGKPHDFGINKNTGNPCFVIKDNVVKDSRRNAVRMRNGLSYGIFEHNLFEGNEDPPLSVMALFNCSGIYVYDNQVRDDRTVNEFITSEDVSNLHHDRNAQP